ncbi:uncharacterized protein [Mytilus edulis]
MPFSVLFAICGFIGHTIGFTCDETVSHCFTSINISSTYTMQDKNGVRVYAKDRQLYSHEGPVPTGDIISADGWNLTRMLITANGTMPGPPIFMYQNQTITVLVHNNLVNESVTIHWHGIDQLEHPAMDGVAYVTQCPILPGQFFNYTFKPRFGGTYWYHSHLGIQRDMGLYGAFIVIRKRDYFRKPSMNQHIIQIQEWNHQYDANELLNINPLPEPHSILINGRGQFKGILAPIETFNVTKGERYLFRLIGVGSHSTLLFSIPGLKLKVFETDGFEVVPTVVDKIIIFPAERYDFELELNNVKDKMYNITVSVLSSPNLTIGNDIGLGFLNVANGNSTSSVIISNGNGLIVLNCPFQTYPNKKDFTCILVSDLESTTHLNNDAFSDEHIPKTNEKLLRFLNFGFPEGNSSVNGRIYHSPTVAPLTQPSETDTNCGNCGDEKTCKCSYSISLSSGSEVIMVLMTLGEGATISHPVHMHGHTFEVLKMVIPKVTNNDQFVFTEDIKCSETFNNSQSQCNNAKWRNESWNDYKNIPGIKLTNPVRKDTIVVPYGGYVIIRIDARNPGVWFLHCHIDKHMIEGMAVMLNESFEHQHKYVPEGLPKCNSRLESNSGVVNNATGSILAVCTLPTELHNAVWNYQYTDHSNNAQTTTLTFGITTLTRPSNIRLNALGTILNAWTCISNLTLSSDVSVAVFKSDASYSDANGIRKWVYICMKLTKVADDFFYFYLLSDEDSSVYPKERVYQSSSIPDNTVPVCSTFCQYTSQPRIRTLKKSGSSTTLPGDVSLCEPCDSSCEGATTETTSLKTTQNTTLPFISSEIDITLNITKKEATQETTAQSISTEMIMSTEMAPLEITQKTTTQSVDYKASCAFPEDLKNTLWEYNYTDVANNEEQTTNLYIANTTLPDSVINLNAEGTIVNNWTCINSLDISDTTNVVVFKGDTSFPSGGSRRLYLCMKLTQVTTDLFYFHLLSDIKTSIFPNERVFISEADNPPADNASICSTFCQYTQPLKIRTLRRQGSSATLASNVSLCEPCDSACEEATTMMTSLETTQITTLPSTTSASSNTETTELRITTTDLKDETTLETKLTGKKNTITTILKRNSGPIVAGGLMSFGFLMIPIAFCCLLKGRSKEKYMDTSSHELSNRKEDEDYHVYDKPSETYQIYRGRQIGYEKTSIQQ